MENTITIKGKVKDSNTIKLKDNVLNEWKNQEVVVILKKDKKSSASIKEMLDEMKKGRKIGYVRIVRSELYRV